MADFDHLAISFLLASAAAVPIAQAVRVAQMDVFVLFAP